ncbi:MAG: magnesium-translocating P-type ATPase [Candidatus Gracilibacteria bacterium]
MRQKNKNNQVPWAQSADAVMEGFKTSEKGFSHTEAADQLKKYGKNEISQKGERGALRIFISQFESPLILILIVAAAIAFFTGETVDAVVIFAIVFINAVLGFFQEYKAERALAALKKFVSVKAKVIRDGRVCEIDAADIVLGDIVHLNIGDMIPADIRLFHCDDFTADESSLTGESVPVEKNIDAIDAKKDMPQDITNMAFFGTSVASGLGEGVVVGVGKSTFFGKTAGFLKQPDTETEFHKGIRSFGNLLIKVTFAMTLFILVVNSVLGKSFFDSLLFAIALAVGIAPEMLPILLTITLSNGALKMAKEKVITKSLPAVEDLGNMDILCCDKTGTLTDGELKLFDFQNFDGEHDEQLLLYGLLCNSDRVTKGKKSFGNVVDRALWESEKSAIVRPKLNDFKTLDKNEFDFERRRMSVVVKGEKTQVFVAKGAPDSILKTCTAVRIKGKDEKLTAELHKKIAAMFEKYENEGFRLIAVAEKPYKLDDSDKKDEKDLVFLGLLFFMDPPKKDAKESLLALERLGVEIKVISGDSQFVTHKICLEVGLKIASDRVVTGTELEELSENEFHKYARTYNVFARVTPEQKYKIVQSLSKDGRVVGFLGDGINDAPALRAADVGISVDTAAGIAKEAADIILLKKNLKVIVDGIISGRKIFGNITKYVLNTISANFGNMFTVAASSVFLKFIPILPAQILLNNFMSDIPLLTIASDNVDEDLLKKPKKWQIKMITRFMISFGLVSSIFDLCLILPLIFIFKTSPEMFRTAWFVESALSEIIITFAIRTRFAFWKSRPSGALLLSSALTAVATIGITYLALGANLFEFVKMPASILLFITGVLAAYFVAAEIVKRRFFKKFEI